jgi:hypothetical protein
MVPLCMALESVYGERECMVGVMISVRAHGTMSTIRHRVCGRERERERERGRERDRERERVL